MAREILFKAKRIDNGEWVEGSLVTRKYHNTDEVFDAHIVFDAYEQMGVLNFGSTPVLISPLVEEKDDDGCFRVDYNTICQYTGLTDKNGNKIWENDVISDDGEKVGCVVFCKGSFVMWVQETNECEELLINLCTERWTFYRGEYKRAEVIGNIFDNPELLKEE